MKTQFELEDIKAVSSTVVEMISPILGRSCGNNSDEKIFDQDELATYLKVSRSWVDQKISAQEIPFFKCGKYPRFRKAEVDKWINKNTIQPIPQLSMVREQKK